MTRFGWFWLLAAFWLWIVVVIFANCYGVRGISVAGAAVIGSTIILIIVLTELVRWLFA